LDKPKHIRCAECVFTQVDENASDRRWTAYECGCIRSPYYKSLLNVTVNGGRLSWINWSGCDEGRVNSFDR
jgi:hypothetical protein